MASLAGAAPASRAQQAAAAPTVLRVGHFPNLTHAQALVARSFSREGRGWFESRLGAGVQLQWFTYNAGPSAMEAILARSLDLSYVGVNPAINAHVRSRGAEIRIVAGALAGGSGLVVQGDSPLRKAADFRGRRIATPQLGNTQDVAARAWLTDAGLKVTMTGGDVEVVPTANPDQLSLFRQRKLDGVWTVEPWVSRLELEAGARLLVDDRQSVTTVLVSSVAMLSPARRPLLRRFVQAHVELTGWIGANVTEAQRRVREEFSALTRAELSPTVLARAWPRLTLTAAIDRAVLERFNRDAQRVGLLRQSLDLGRLIEAP